MGEPIEIRYSLGRDDLIAFNVHFSKTSATAQRARQRGIIFSLIAFFLLVLLFTRDARLVLGNMVYWGVMGFVFLMCVPVFRYYVRRYHHRASARFVGRAFDEGRNRAVMGERLLRVTDRGLETESEFVNSQMRWPLVERVDVTKDHVFIFIGSMQALIVPRKAFAGDGQLMAMLQFIGQRADVSLACPRCGYNLRGSHGGRCPECGFPQ